MHKNADAHAAEHGARGRRNVLASAEHGARGWRNALVPIAMPAVAPAALMNPILLLSLLKITMRSNLGRMPCNIFVV